MAETNADMRVVRYTVSGRIDAENAGAFRRGLELVFDEAAALELDCRDLNYISSAGLRVLLQFQKRMSGGRKLRLNHIAPQVREVLDVSGFTEIMDVRAAARQITLDGCRLIARGGTGECYQMDSETVVKLYYENTPDALIEREKLGAKAAFVSGIPTAISYDMVECGARRGIVYELLNAQTLSQVAVKHPERIPELGARYARLARQIHETRGDARLFPRWTSEFYALEDNFSYLSRAGKARYRAFLDGLSSYDTYVHGDFNPNNIMLSDDELLLIDMGEFSIGCPMFDLAALRLTFFYCANPADDEVYAFTGMTGAQQRGLWDAFVREYFHTQDAAGSLARDPDAGLIEPITLIKAMRCAALFPDAFSREWIAQVVRDAKSRFE